VSKTHKKLFERAAASKAARSHFRRCSRFGSRNQLVSEQEMIGSRVHNPAALSRRCWRRLAHAGATATAQEAYEGKWSITCRWLQPAFNLPHCHKHPPLIQGLESKLPIKLAAFTSLGSVTMATDPISRHVPRPAQRVAHQQCPDAHALEFQITRSRPSKVATHRDTSAVASKAQRALGQCHDAADNVQ